MTRKNPAERKNTMIKTVLFWTLVLALGYFLVEYVSEMDDPPLGMTFHIIVGCLLIAIALIVLFVKLKKYFFPKKKKNRTRPTFLKDELKRENENVN